MEASYPGVRLSKAILKDFWPDKNNTKNKNENDEFLGESLLSQAVKTRLREMAEMTQNQGLCAFVEKFEEEETRRRNMTGASYREMSRSRWNRRNPFLNASQEKKGTKKNGSNRKNIGRKVEQVGLKNMIDEDLLDDRSMRDAFQMKKETQNTYLMMLILAYVDKLMVFMGPSQSIEFLLPVYFTILSVNANYHCHYKNVVIDKKPVRLFYIS